ncbi:MAG: serine hydrolase [Synechococcus sp.]
MALGLACGVIARRWGSTLSALPDASDRYSTISAPAPNSFIAPSSTSIRPGSPIAELNQALQNLDAEYPNLQMGTVLVDISQRNYAGLRDREAFPAASTIKIAILVALLEAVDRSEINLDETLALSPNFIVGGSGTLSNRSANSQVPVVEAAELMIAVSDNTASNLLLDRLGGVEALNRRFRAWGLQHTRLRNPLPDLEGTNTTSPGDLALLLGELERGQILTMRSRDRFFEILQTTQNNSLLPQALTEDDRIAHKTGNINSSLGDVGLVDLPNGQRYIVVVLVRRENGDPEAETVIRKVSRLARDYWSSQGEASQ